MPGPASDASQDVPDKPMLKCLKARTGITEAGDRYLLERNSEDLSLNIQQYNGLNDGIEGLKNRKQGVGQAAADGHEAGGRAVDQAHW